MKSLVTLSELFSDRIFRIPDYQRGYAWQEDQLRDFWEDIVNLPKGHSHYTGMISLKELDNSNINQWDSEDRWIINDQGYRAYHVIDGQQRLTTFIIFLKCIVELTSSIGETRINNEKIELIINKYLYEENKDGMLRAYKFGYEKDNPSFDYLKHHILDEDDTTQLEKTFYTLNLQNAKDYFKKQLEELYKEGFDKIEEIFFKATKKLHFNIYEIESGFDVNVAFETMNNRGKKLSNLEILKNRLIYLVTVYDDKTLSADSKEGIRKKINNAWKEIYKQLGRKETNPLNDDEYLRNHWIMYFKYSRQKGDDYINFLLKDFFTVRAVQGKEREIRLYDNQTDDMIEDEVIDVFKDDTVLHYKEIEKYALSLSELSKYWAYSYHPEFAIEAGYSEDEVKWLTKLNRVDIAYYRPLVVVALRDKKMTSEERVRLFEIIEKCIFVWFRMASFNSTLYSIESYNMARILLTNTVNEKSKDKYLKTFEQLTNELGREPRKRELSERLGITEFEVNFTSLAVKESGKSNTTIFIEFLESKFKQHLESAKENFVARIKNYFLKDGYFDWSYLRYFLYEYENYLYEKAGRKEQRPADWRQAVKGYYSIEHIYPQTPQDWYWLNQFRDYSEDEKSICTKTLGNMLLLSKDINSALQNHSYPRKCQPLNKERTGYIDGSFSEREVAKTYKDWNPNSIYKRTMVLIKFFKTRWGVSFNTAQKEVLSGMSFMSKERVLSNELFNHNTFTDTLKSTFEANGYLVNIESRYIQFMKPDWVFNDNTHTSIHFELKISSNNRFDNLLGNQVPIYFAFHTETDCPDDLRRMFKPTRKEIGEPLIVDDFKTIDAYNASLEKVIIFIEDMFKTYGDNISNVIENHNQ